MRHLLHYNRKRTNGRRHCVKRFRVLADNMINRRLFSQVKKVKSIKPSWSSFYSPFQLTSPFNRSYGTPNGVGLPSLIGTPITAWYMAQIHQDDNDKDAPLSITFPKNAIKVSYIRLCLRIIYLGLIITPVMLLFPIWALFEYLLGSDALRLRMVRLLCWTLEKMGPTFIKVRLFYKC